MIEMISDDCHYVIVSTLWRTELFILLLCNASYHCDSPSFINYIKNIKKL